jgi:hypothetical protein
MTSLLTKKDQNRGPSLCYIAIFHRGSTSKSLSLQNRRKDESVIPYKFTILFSDDEKRRVLAR